MTPAFEYRFEAETAALKEAMLYAGRTVISDRKLRAGLFLGQMTFVILTCAGGGAVGVAVAIIVFGVRPEEFFPWAMIGIVLATIFGPVWQNTVYRIMARASTQTRFGSGAQMVRFDPTGVRYETATGRWDTDWAGVEGVHRGKHGISVAISGTAIAIPISAVDDPDALMAQVAEWQQ